MSNLKATALPTRIIVHLILVLVFVLAVFPLFWTLVSSTRLLRDIITPVPTLIHRPTLKNFATILKVVELRRALAYSAIVAPVAVLLGFLMDTPLAYVLDRHRFRDRETVQFWIITLRMLPPVAIIFPLISIWTKLALFDTYPSLVVTYLLITIPTIAWLSIEPFGHVPAECEEAATLEDYGNSQVFFKVALPLAWPEIVSGVLFSFILVWNEFFISILFDFTQDKTAGRDWLLHDDGNGAAMGAMLQLPQYCSRFHLYSSRCFSEGSLRLSTQSARNRRQDPKP